MRSDLLRRALASCVLLGTAGLVAAEAAALLDLFAFEYGPLMQLVGVSGILVIVGVNLGVLLLASRAVFTLRGRPHPYSAASNMALVAWVFLLLWLAEWVYMATPLTARLASLAQNQTSIVLPKAVEPDFARFSLRQGITDAESLEHLRVMYERIRLNYPQMYAGFPIGATIDKYAQRYQVDPTLLFFFAYVGSFWGEATSGPVPFLRAMTPETIRDVVQVHLPGWFIESDLRRELISSSMPERLFGSGLGFKLRYALHKATLDVSSQPYDLNLYTDVFLVLRENPNEFPELSQQAPANSLVAALRSSFHSLRDNALLAPYEQPYTHAAYDATYYTAKRADLKRFARAAFYLIESDFDFATRVAALVIDYQRKYYAMRIGKSEWMQIPDWQKAAMLAMTRDLYIPAVGRLGYNLYALPELNCTPVEFVAAAAIAEQSALGEHQSALWRPKNYQDLWGGAGTKLRIFNELWSVIHGQPLPGPTPENTVDDARRIVLLAAAHSGQS